MWQDKVYIQHVTIEGLIIAGGIQGNMANACLLIMKHHDIGPAMKWVDDFVFFRGPLSLQDKTFLYDLLDILCITVPLGIPWHPVTWKGQGFDNIFTYVSFKWNIQWQSVSVS